MSPDLSTKTERRAYYYEPKTIQEFIAPFMHIGLLSRYLQLNLNLIT